MKFLSICSGIEAASVAWHPLGWQAVGFSEIEPFPSAVLAHHWPDVPNLGDMTKHHDWTTRLLHKPDLIVGGTPCQAFSVAGLRKGLADPRGNLTLTFLSIVEQYRPSWVVWENVPGVLSEKTGAFGAFLGGLGELGYGFAYRVLDAQHFGVPQRRRRVFVVGCLGNWRRAAAVLFEPHSLSGNPPPSREAGKIAPTIPSRSLGGGGLGTDFDCDGGLIPHVAGCLQTTCNDHSRADGFNMIPVCGPLTAGMGKGPRGTEAVEGNHLIPTTQFGPIAGSLTARHDSSPCADRGQNIVAVAAQDEVYSIAENIIGRQDHNGGNGKGFQKDIAYTLNTVAPPAVAFSCKDHGADAGEEISPTLRSMGHDGSHANGGGQVAVAFGVGEQPEVGHCLRSGASKADKHESTTYIKQATAVRRLTPTECERLQGFPDGHTLIPWRGKPADQCPDGPRYKALGNSMAVPVMRWIGERIQLISTF